MGAEHSSKVHQHRLAWRAVGQGAACAWWARANSSQGQRQWPQVMLSVLYRLFFFFFFFLT